MSYLVPSEFVTKMVDAVSQKYLCLPRDTLIRAFMAGAILHWRQYLAITSVGAKPGFPDRSHLVPSLAFVCCIYGFLTYLLGVFVLTPLASLSINVAGVHCQRHTGATGGLVSFR